MTKAIGNLIWKNGKSKIGKESEFPFDMKKLNEEFFGFLKNSRNLSADIRSPYATFEGSFPFIQEMRDYEGVYIAIFKYKYSKNRENYNSCVFFSMDGVEWQVVKDMSSAKFQVDNLLELAEMKVLYTFGDEWKVVHGEYHFNKKGILDRAEAFFTSRTRDKDFRRDIDEIREYKGKLIAKIGMYNKDKLGNWKQTINSWGVRFNSVIFLSFDNDEEFLLHSSFLGAKSEFDEDDFVPPCYDKEYWLKDYNSPDECRCGFEGAEFSVLLEEVVSIGPENKDDDYRVVTYNKYGYDEKVAVHTPIIEELIEDFRKQEEAKEKADVGEE